MDVGVDVSHTSARVPTMPKPTSWIGPKSQQRKMPTPKYIQLDPSFCSMVLLHHSHKTEIRRDLYGQQENGASRLSE